VEAEHESDEVVVTGGLDADRAADRLVDLVVGTDEEGRIPVDRLKYRRSVCSDGPVAVIGRTPLLPGIEIDRNRRRESGSAHRCNCAQHKSAPKLAILHYCRLPLFTRWQCRQLSAPRA